MGSKVDGGKRAVLERLLDHSMVMVTLDARARGVVVPDHLKGDRELRLNLSYRFGLPLAVDDHGVAATLTFGGVPFACRLPWDSIYGMISHATGEPFFFPEDAPAGLVAQPAAHPAEGSNGQAPEQQAPRLGVVADPKPAEEPAPAQKSPPRRGHLRLVK